MPNEEMNKDIKPLENVKKDEVVPPPPKKGNSFMRSIIASDAKTCWDYTLRNVIIPEIISFARNSVVSFVDTMFYGPGRTGAPNKGVVSGASYEKYYQNGQNNQQKNPLPRNSKRTPRYDEVYVKDQKAGEDLIVTISEAISRYDQCSVATFIDNADRVAPDGVHYLVDPGDISLQRYGWTSIRGMRVVKTYAGDYVMDMPRPVLLEDAK